MNEASQKFIKVAVGLFWACTVAGGVYFGVSEASRQWKEAQATFYERASRLERAVIDSVPTFEDYADAAVEKKLRRYLQKDHMRAARLSAKLGNYSPLAADEEITPAVEKKILVGAPATRDDLYYYYNVPLTHRYLRPSALKALELITGRLREKLHELSPENGAVKLAISSALRTAGYQKSVRQKNYNAVIESTHSYGVSFDLFYEDYYISFSEVEELVEASWMLDFYRESFEKQRVKHGFLMGDALRRQLHTLLHQVLVELQDEGVLYAILEKRQKCYHITALP